jgi:prepilin-type N-terminal cleavage/methylation domain-containing protein
MHASRRIRSGFSLIELVIVVVIIGIIAAIAIPRMSRGAAGAGDSALTGDLAVIRKALDLYAAEHGGTYPDTTNIVAQLTSKSNIDGTFTGTPIYGPYLQKIPPLPVGTYKGNNTILTTGLPGAAAGGWLYLLSGTTSCTLQANCPNTDVDAAGTKYNAY